MLRNRCPIEIDRELRASRRVQDGMTWTRGQNGSRPRRPVGCETPGRAAFRELEAVLCRDGAVAAARRFRQLRRLFPHRVGESLVNVLGYILLAKGDVAAAIDAFKLNVEVFPESFNAHDSLAEAYMDAGEVTRAIRHYERSVELNSGNAHGVRMLAELRRQSPLVH